METQFKEVGDRFQALNNELLLENKNKSLNNIKRRVYHSKLELLKLDMEELIPRSSETQKPLITAICSEIDTIISKLSLIPIERPHKWWYQLEVSLRFVGIVSSFMMVGSLCSLPLIAMRALDELMQVDPFKYRSEYFKRSIAWLLLFQSGIMVDVKGVEHESFKESCALLCFNHSSNVDGFLVAGICPIRQLAFGKKELFLVPFFSWISLAFGGVPVDRGNRDRAVGALKRSTEAAKTSKVCIAVAPEGTRSLTGQLLPFKKGPFHMWDELKAPIVPMLIFGAYDLYPVGSWVNQTGHIAVRYLPPILHTEAADKDAMLILLKRRMLEGIALCPPDVGRELSTPYWLLSLAMNVMMIANLAIIAAISYNVLVVRYHLSLLTIALWWTIGVFAITAGLYIYYVYLIDLGKYSSSRSTLSSSSGSEKVLSERDSKKGSKKSN